MGAVKEVKKGDTFIASGGVGKEFEVEKIDDETGTAHLKEVRAKGKKDAELERVQTAVDNLVNEDGWLGKQTT